MLDCVVGEGYQPLFLIHSVTEVNVTLMPVRLESC